MLCSDISHPGSPPAPPAPGPAPALLWGAVHFGKQVTPFLLLPSRCSRPDPPLPHPALLVFLISLLESHDSNRVLQVCTVRLTGSPPKAPLPILVLWVLPPNPAHAGRHHFPSLGDPCCVVGFTNEPMPVYFPFLTYANNSTFHSSAFCSFPA